MEKKLEILKSFQDKFENRDYWGILEEQCQGNYGWMDYYSVLYPNYKVSVGHGSAYTEVLPFAGINADLIRQRVGAALKDVGDGQLLEIARRLGVKLV